MEKRADAEIDRQEFLSRTWRVSRIPVCVFLIVGVAWLASRIARWGWRSGIFLPLGLLALVFVLDGLARRLDARRFDAGRPPSATWRLVWLHCLGMGLAYLAVGVFALVTSLPGEGLDMIFGFASIAYGVIWLFELRKGL